MKSAYDNHLTRCRAYAAQFNLDLFNAAAQLAISTTEAPKQVKDVQSRLNRLPWYERTDAAAFFELHGIRYFGELLERYGEKLGDDSANTRAIALAVNRAPELALFPQNLQDGAFGLAFEKGDPRRDAWQAAFDAIPRESIEAAWDKWTGADESVKVLPEQDWPGENGTVRVAACDTLEPMSYMGGDGELKGFDLEVILMIAREMDVRVEFTGMEFSAILSSVQSGKADIGAGSIIITEERAQAVDFVEYYPAAFVLIVRAKQAEVASLTPRDFNGKLAGVITGSFHDSVIAEELPDSSISQYNNYTDMVAALN